MPAKLLPVIVISLLLGVNTFTSHAQFYSRQFSFTHITNAHGLPHNTVYCILQDRQGFMWFGTYGGLVRYDGYKMKVYSYIPGDSTSISDNSVFCMAEDDDGYIWSGNQRTGINVFDPRTEKFRRYEHHPHDTASLSSNNVRAICKDKDGNIWIGTSKGLNKYDRKTKRIVRFDDKGEVPRNIFGLYSDKDENRIWVCVLDKGLWSLDTENLKFTNYLHNSEDPYSLGSFHTCNAAKDKNGVLWIGTRGNGVNSLDLKTGKFTRYSHDPNDPRSVTNNDFWRGDVFVDSDNNVWAGAELDGLNFFDRKNNNWIRIQHNPSDPASIGNDDIRCIYEDRNGLIWVGSSGGVSIYNKAASAFTVYRHIDGVPASISGNDISAVYEDSRKTLWLGSTDGGVDYYNNITGERGRCSKQTGTLSHNSVIGFAEDKNGRIWTAGFWQCPSYFDAKGGRFIKVDSIHCHNSNSIFSDRSKKVWIGGNGSALSCYDFAARKRKYFPSVNNDSTTLSHNYITDIIEASDRTIWVGSYEGLNALDPGTGKARRYYMQAGKSSLSNNSIVSLSQDNKGIIWAGTMAGLTAIDPAANKITQYYKKDGLASDYVAAILPGDNDVWFGTSNGLCRLDHATGRFFTFDVTDGLPSNEFTGAAFKGSGGRLYFGTTNGLLAFYPARIRTNPHKPDVVITEFTVLNKPWELPQAVSLTKEIELSFREYFFAFEFAALDYTAPAKNQYAYKLEGFNKEWVYLGNKREATFTNLDAGEYVLKVKASNNHGLWSDEKEIVRITISPPWWKTKTFYSASIMVVLLLVGAFIKVRERNLKIEKRLLEIKVRRRTRELELEKRKVEKANADIVKQKEVIEEKNKDITDSIYYAKRIQEAILPSGALLERHTREFFILYKPKDIVSGDFYWVNANDEKILIATADCTGHGVPGAFMSMIGSRLLNEIVVERNVTRPDHVLNDLRTGIIKALNPTGSTIETKDGMDVTLYSFDLATKELQYAAAYNSFYVIRDKVLMEQPADKFPVGKYGEVLSPFTLRTVQLQEGDCIYTFTDGYADQFGGPNGKKFKYRSFQQLLVNNCHLPMEQQHNILNETIENWKGELEQVDDILVIGLRI
jgi:ligand-binding sensor domain-containing protein/serine phosphatase RsbU (regulator of sigma subunit)